MIDMKTIASAFFGRLLAASSAFAFLGMDHPFVFSRFHCIVAALVMIGGSFRISRIPCFGSLLGEFFMFRVGSISDGICHSFFVVLEILRALVSVIFSRVGCSLSKQSSFSASFALGAIALLFREPVKFSERLLGSAFRTKFGFHGDLIPVWASAT